MMYGYVGCKDGSSFTLLGGHLKVMFKNRDSGAKLTGCNLYFINLLIVGQGNVPQNLHV